MPPLSHCRQTTCCRRGPCGVLPPTGWGSFISVAHFLPTLQFQIQKSTIHPRQMTFWPSKPILPPQKAKEMLSSTVSSQNISEDNKPKKPKRKDGLKVCCFFYLQDYRETSYERVCMCVYPCVCVYDSLIHSPS